jgi:hypothetical protein
MHILARFCRAELLTILVTLAILPLLGHASTAAEIGCTRTWQSQVHALDYDYFDYFPSGRRPSPDTCDEVLIKGEITLGDSKKFADFIQLHQPFVERVLLWSAGGSVSEALSIGRLVRKAMLETKAPHETYLPPSGNGTLEGFAGHLNICRGQTCHCASACFLIWAAGIKRSGNAIGLHRPSIHSAEFADLSPERAVGLYRLLIKNIDEYLTQMEVPRRYIEAMIDASSTGIRWLDFDEGKSMEDVPSISEWLNAACPNGGTYTYHAPTEKLLSVLDGPTAPCKEKKLDSSRDALVGIADQKKLQEELQKRADEARKKLENQKLQEELRKRADEVRKKLEAQQQPPK